MISKVVINGRLLNIDNNDLVKINFTGELLGSIRNPTPVVKESFLPIREDKNDSSLYLFLKDLQHYNKETWQPLIFIFPELERVLPVDIIEIKDGYNANKDREFIGLTFSYHPGKEAIDYAFKKHYETGLLGCLIAEPKSF